MKKLLNQIILLSLIIGVGCFPLCTHVHTEECGENGIECTHECHEDIYIPNEPKPGDPPRF